MLILKGSNPCLINTVVPVGRQCVWASLSGWVCPVLIFLELGVSPPQLLAGLSNCLLMLNMQRALWLESALRDNGGVFFQVLKPNRCGHRVEEVVKHVGSAAFLTGESQTLATQWRNLCQRLFAI